MQICSCKGLNPNCDKCFGSGYAEEAVSKDSPSAGSTKKIATDKKAAKTKSSIQERIKSLTRKEIESISLEIIASIDLKSKKQMQLLNSISFSTTTFRRDFKGKFESLKSLENDKRFLRNELDIILKDTADKKYFQAFKFDHLLSDKDIDVDSNRELKTLIREYKKLKAKTP